MGDRLRPWPPAQRATSCGQLVGAIAARGHGCLQHGARKGDWLQGGTRKGRPPTACPQGVAANSMPARGSRQRPARKGWLHWPGLLPIGAVAPTAGVAADRQGQSLPM
ncbi:hypothetical protein GW17_00032125 [Ensete ventricosum]|nr:hypothetical protein GW17_00032125 [Ensete ventricosum]RZS27860.1 hypothetical protein BHM03_00061389 [Ensete ventricosum]